MSTQVLNIEKEAASLEFVTFRVDVEDKEKQKSYILINAISFLYGAYLIAEDDTTKTVEERCALAALDVFDSITQDYTVLNVTHQ